MINVPLITQPDILSPMVLDTRIGRKILYTFAFDGLLWKVNRHWFLSNPQQYLYMFGV